MEFINIARKDITNKCITLTSLAKTLKMVALDSGIKCFWYDKMEMK